MDRNAVRDPQQIPTPIVKRACRSTQFSFKIDNTPDYDHKI